MKTTIRTATFETNSSSMHTFVHASEKTLDEWKRGEKILKEGCLYSNYGEEDFMSVKEWSECGKPMGCTYEEFAAVTYDNALDDIADLDEVIVFASGRHGDEGEETVIHTDKKTFEAWIRGDVILNDGRLEGETYESKDFIPVKKDGKWADTYARGCTYEGMLKYYSKLGGDDVPKKEAKEKYVDPEEWERASKDDKVFQRRYMETEYDGSNVTVRMWGRYEG
jgi:hypothetical protein